jgi:hypothetical protein
LLTDIFDAKYLENEERYTKSIKAEILGEESGDESGSGSDEDDSDELQEGQEVCTFFLFLRRRKTNWSHLDRAHQHDY